MKKLLCGILAVVLILALLAACGETENPTTTTTTQASTTTTTTTNPTTTIEQVDLNNYIGYWYHCLIMDRNNLDEQFFVDVHQLHIKSVENNVITFDYALTTMIDEENIVAEVKDNVCEFQVDGCSVVIEFYNDDYGDALIGVMAYDDDTHVLAPLSLHTSTKPVEAEFKVTPADNYDFKDYLGYWYIEEPELPDGPYLYNGIDEIHIKNVEGNVVTFDYELYYQGPVWDNDIVVEINNNVGLFKGKQSFGVLRFTEDSVVIDAHTLYGGGTIIDEMTFDYQTSTDWNKKLEEYTIQNGYA